MEQTHTCECKEFCPDIAALGKKPDNEYLTEQYLECCTTPACNYCSQRKETLKTREE